MKKSTRVLLPLFLLVVLPIFGAMALYFYFPAWIPAAKTNHGELMAPARPAPAFAEPLKGRWTYVQLTGATCEAECLETLAKFRQIRLALNEKRERVQRVLLVPDEPAAVALKAALNGEHPDLIVQAEAAGAARTFFAPSDARAVYLLDPNGNWLMTYPAVSESRGIFKDIKRLLKLSQIG